MFTPVHTKNFITFLTVHTLILSLPINKKNENVWIYKKNFSFQLNIYTEMLTFWYKYAVILIKAYRYFVFKKSA